MGKRELDEIWFNAMERQFEEFEMLDQIISDWKQFEKTTKENINKGYTENVSQDIQSQIIEMKLLRSKFESEIALRRYEREFSSHLNELELLEQLATLKGDKQPALAATETSDPPKKKNLPTKIEQLFRSEKEYDEVIKILRGCNINLITELKAAKNGDGVAILCSLYKKGWIPELSYENANSAMFGECGRGTTNTTFCIAQKNLVAEGKDRFAFIPYYAESSH